ncbi:mucin-17-like [Rattus norvegicus]|uniref:mucin-17-like n=1 Tax=Rattus norvegicus TaxID=10116 RepID=UPI002FD8280F
MQFPLGLGMWAKVGRSGSLSCPGVSGLPTLLGDQLSLPQGFRGSFKCLFPTLQVCNLSNSPPKWVGQDTTGQGELQQAPSDKEGSKTSSPKGNLSDFSISTNGLSPGLSPQETLTPLTAAKAGQRNMSTHKDSQRCPTSIPKCPMQSASSQVSLKPDSADKEDFRTSLLNQEGFQSPPLFKNGLKSSLTVQGEQNAVTVPQVNLIPLIPAQAETKLSTCTALDQGPLSFSEGILESSTPTQDVVENSEFTQGTLVPSAHVKIDIAPSTSSPVVPRHYQSVRGTRGLSTSTEKGQRRLLNSIVPQKRRLKYSAAMTRDPEHSCSRRRLKDAPSKQRVFTMSLSDRELFKYPLPPKRTLLTCHQAQKSQVYDNTQSMSHADSIFVQCAEKIKPSLPPQGTLGYSVLKGEALKFSTRTSEMLEFPKTEQDSLSSTLSHKETVGQETPTKVILPTATSLDAACGCDKYTKHVLGHIPSVEKVMDPIICEQGVVRHDMQTQVSIASLTSKERDSLDSICAKKCIRPPQNSQEAMGTSLSPQDQPCSPTTQDAIHSSKYAERVVSLTLYPQAAPEHLPNTPKALDFTLSSEGALEPVLPIKQARKPDTSIQKSAPSPAEEGFLGTSTSTQQCLETSLSAHEALRPLTYVHDALGEATFSEVALIPSPHSEVTVKTSTNIEGILRPSSSEKDALGSTASEQHALQVSPSTQVDLFHVSTLGRNSQHPPSTKVDRRHPVSRNKGLRVDPSDGDLRNFSSEEDSFDLPPSAKRELVPSSATKETPKATTTPQVSPTPSPSVQRALECSKNDQGIVESCQSSQGHAGHPILSQEAQGTSLSTQKACSSSPPVLQGISSPLSRAPENVPHAQGDLSLCKLNFKNTKPLLYFEGSVGKSTLKKNHLELVPLAQVYPKNSMSSKASKNLSGSNTLAEKLLPSTIQSPRPSKSKKGYLETLPLAQRSLGCSATSPRAQCTQRTKEVKPSAQGVEEGFQTSVRKPGHFPHLPENKELSLLAQGVLGHVPHSQEHMETSSYSPGFTGPLMPLQRPLDLSTTTQSTAAPSPNKQGALPALVPPPSKVGTCQSAQEMLGPLLPNPEALVISPSDFVAPVGQSLSGQQTLKLSIPTQGTLKHSLSSPGDMAPALSSQGTKGPLPSVGVDMRTYEHAQGSPGQLTNVSGFPRHMLSEQDPGGISLPAQGSLTHLPSTHGAEGLSLSTHQARELSTLEQGTIQPLKPAEMALKNPASSKEPIRHVPCTQDALEHLLPCIGALKHCVADQGTQKFLASAQEAHETLQSNSKALETSPGTGCLQSSLTIPKPPENILSSKEPEELSLSAPGSLGLLLSSQEAPERLAPSREDVKTCQYAVEKLRTLTLSPTVLESPPSISATQGALSSVSRHTGLSSLTIDRQEHSQHVEGVMKSSSVTGTEASMAYFQRPLENSSCGQGTIDSLTSSQGTVECLLFTPQAVEKPRSTKGRIENVSSLERSAKPVSDFQELSGHSLLTQGPHQHSKSAPGSQGPYKPDSAIQRHLPSPEVTGKLTSAPGALQPGPNTLKSLDHLQTAEGSFELSVPLPGVLDPSPSTQGTLQSLVSSPVVVKLSKSGYRKLGHLSNVGKDTDIFPSDTIAKGTSPAPHSSLATEALVSSSSCQGSQGSLLASKEGVEDSLSAPDAQKPYPSTTQALESLVTTQGPLDIYTPAKWNLHSLPSTLGDLPLQSTLEMPSLPQETLEPLASDQVEGTKYQSEKDNLGQTISGHGTVGSSPCKTGALGSTQHAHRKVQILPYNQGAENHSTSHSGAMGLPKSDTRTPNNLPSDQGSVKSFNSFQKGSTPSLCIHDTVQHSPTATEALRSSSSKKPLSSPNSVKMPSTAPPPQKPPQTTSATQATVRCKQGPLEHSMSVQGSGSSFSSTPGFLDHSTSSQKKLGYSSCKVESQDTWPTVQGTIGSLPSHSEPKVHSPHDQGAQESSLVVSRDLSELLPTKLCISAQATLGPSTYTQQSLQQSSSSQKILGTFESAQCTHKHLPSDLVSSGMSSQVPRTTGILSHAPKPLGHSSPSQASPVSPPSLQKAVTTSINSQATLELDASGQISVFPPLSTHVPGQASLHAEATLGQPISAQRIEEILLSSSGTLSYKESDKQEVESCPCAQGPQGVSLPTKGTLRSVASAQGGLGITLSAQGSLKLSMSKPESIRTVPSVPNSLKHPTPSQRDLKISPSVQHTVQCSSSSRQTTGTVLSSQANQGTFLSSSGYAQHYPSTAGVQVHPLSTPAAVGPLLTSQGQKENFTAGKGTMPEQSSLSSIRRKLEPSINSSGILAQQKDTESTLGHLPDVREGVASSQYASATQGTWLPSPPESDKHSSSTQGGAETFPSGQGCLAHLQSAVGPLKLSISAQAMTNISQCSESCHGPLGCSSLEQGAQVPSDLVHAAVSPCLSTQGTVCLPTSTQSSTRHSTSTQRLGSPSLHTQGTGTQSTSTDCTVSDSPSSPVYQGDIHPSQKMAGTLKSDQGSLRFSANAQGSVEPLASAQGPLGYSSSAPGSQKTSTSTPGHVVPDDSPLDLSISDELSSLFSSLSLLDHPLSTERTFDLSKPIEGTLGPSTSCQGPIESLDSAQGLQQTEPSASDSSGSVHSSKGPMKISLSGQGTLESVSSVLGPLAMSLTVQVSPGPLLSVQEVGGSCQSLQGNLESCTCRHGEPGISNSSLGDFKISATTTVSLGSSLSVQLDMEVSQPVLLSLRPSLSAQGFLGTSSSAQRAMNLSSDTLESTESLGYAQDDLELRSPCLGTQKPSEFSQNKLQELPTDQMPPENSYLAHKTPGSCLEKEAIGHSPSDTEDVVLLESAQGTVETLPCMQNTAEIPPVSQEIKEPFPPAQYSLRFRPSATFTPEAEEPLPSTQSNFKISESVSRNLESFPSVPGALGILKPNKSTLDPLVSKEMIQKTPTSPQETLELSQPGQGPLEPMPSTQDSVGTLFSTDIPGLSLCSQDDFIPFHSYEECPTHFSFSKKDPRHLKSTQRMLKYAPFPEGDISYSLSELDDLKCIPSAESRFTSSKNDRKNSSPTSTPQRSSSPLKSSKLNFKSSTPPKECLRHSPSPGHCSRHSKSEKTRSRHASSDQAGVKTVPSEDEEWKHCRSSKIGVQACKSDKRGEKLKTETNRNLTTSDSAKGACRSSTSREMVLRSPAPLRSNNRRSKSTKTTSKKVPSDQRDTQASHSEHERVKLSSLSKMGLRHSSDSRNVSSDLELITSALGNLKLSPSAQGGTRASQPAKWDL